MQVQLVKAPAHGEFKTSGYKMWFKSAVVGPDSYSVDVTWRGLHNEVLKARVDSQVTVVAAPM